MQEFFENVFRYPRYLISLILGILISFLKRFKPLFSNPISATAVIGLFLGVIAFLFFTLRAMLGISV